MKRTTKKGLSELSRAASDKLLACLNHGVNIGSAGYLQSPDYFAACARWHAELTPDQRETIPVVTDCYVGPHRDAAEGIARDLPAERP